MSDPVSSPASPPSATAGNDVTALSFTSDLAAKYANAIRKHRDKSRGSQRCWQNDEELWALLPEGYSPPVRDHEATLAECAKYLEHCHNPAVHYVDPQQQINDLQQEVAELRATLRGYVQNIRNLAELCMDAIG